jgi:hypothetical protein
MSLRAFGRMSENCRISISNSTSHKHKRASSTLDTMSLNEELEYFTTSSLLTHFGQPVHGENLFKPQCIEYKVSVLEVQESFLALGLHVPEVIDDEAIYQDGMGRILTRSMDHLVESSA